MFPSASFSRCWCSSRDSAFFTQLQTFQLCFAVLSTNTKQTQLIYLHPETSVHLEFTTANPVHCISIQPNMCAAENMIEIEKLTAQHLSIHLNHGKVTIRRPASATGQSLTILSSLAQFCRILTNFSQYSKSLWQFGRALTNFDHF